MHDGGASHSKPGELSVSDAEIEAAREQLIEKLTGKKGSKYARFIVSAAMDELVPRIG